MSRLRVVAAAAAAVLTLIGNAALAAETACWQPAEMEAARVRDLQTMLMLGAVKCGAAGSDAVTRYNAFINQKRETLNGYNNVLKARFMHQHGIAGGETAYHSFTTDLANSHSDRAQSASFCRLNDTLLTLATNASDAELPLLARNLSYQPYGVGDVCEATAALPEPTVPAPAKVVTAPAETEPAVAAAPTPTPPSAAEALEAAAVAMQAAAAAMKAQSAPTQPVESAATPKPTGATIHNELKPAVVQPAPVVPPAPIG